MTVKQMTLLLVNCISSGHSNRVRAKQNTFGFIRHVFFHYTGVPSPKYEIEVEAEYAGPVDEYSHTDEDEEETQQEQEDSEPEPVQQQQDDTNDSLLYVSINQIDQNRECNVTLENIDHLIKKYTNESKKTPPKRRTKKRPSKFPDTESEIDSESGVETEPEMHVPVIETDPETPNESERENQCERGSEPVDEVHAIDDDDESEPELNFRPSVIQPRELRTNYENLSPIPVTSSDDECSATPYDSKNNNNNSNNNHNHNNNDDDDDNIIDVFVISSDSE